LQPVVFARILLSWERHWIEGGHDQALDRAVEGFAGEIRKRGRQLPTPLEGIENDGDSGNDVNADWQES